MRRSYRTRRLLGCLAAAVVCSLCVLAGASSSFGAYSHPTAGEHFGTDGTAATEFNGLESLAFNQSNGHLFAYASSGGGTGTGIYGFQVNSATSRSPLGAPFPLEAGGGAYAPRVAVNSDRGYIYHVIGYPFEEIDGVTEAGAPISGHFPIHARGFTCGVAVDGEGHVFVPYTEPEIITEYTPDGVEMRSLHLVGQYESNYCQLAFDQSTNDLFAAGGPEAGIWRFSAASNYTRKNLVYPGEVSALAYDNAEGIIYAIKGGSKIVGVRPSGSIVEEFEIPGGESINGLAIDEADQSIYVAHYNRVEVFPAGPILANVTTGGLVSATPSSATVSGTVDPAGGPPITECEVEYGEDTSYSLGSVLCDQETPITAAGGVTATLPGLIGGRIYHYRFVVHNANGESIGGDKTATVARAPSIDGLSSSAVTADSADVNALINPQGGATSYFFEYGGTVAYGSRIPVAPAAIGSAQEDVSVTAHLEGLSSGTYHFRVIAENAYGRTVSEDQTFSFYPPECPNSLLREQTGGSNLPDCRAYELVSPGNAGGAVMFPETPPPAPYATSPARFPFAAGLGAIPGTEPTNGIGVDVYLATRTDTGWVTKYTGVKGSETLAASIPIGDLGWNKIFDFREKEDFGGIAQPYDTEPYIWDPVGNLLERWPTGFDNIPGSSESFGAWQPSPDFSHLAFSSRNVAWTPSGKVVAPGSAYDYDIADHTTTLISLLPNGEPMTQSPLSESSEEFILFPGNSVTYGGPQVNQPTRGNPAQIYPGVSTDGSHILMSLTEKGFENRRERSGLVQRVKLYMRVDDAVTYAVSAEKFVNYVGMTEDGSKVFFTSKEALLPEDTDGTNDLYMWSEATDGLTLVSKGNKTAGGVEIVEGEDETDNVIAADTGAIYFYSTEILEANHGVPGKRNLYVYRDGGVEFVATLGQGAPATRFQVSPDGLHAAFLTASKLGSYDNEGHAEMYSFEPTSEKLACVSCLPNGEPPNGETEASIKGLFMSNDGRTFFYTPEALVPQDTDNIRDVYEYTGGQARLITNGTAAQDRVKAGNPRAGGLSGVSADGVNVYFATYETLVPEDENGQFLKFYDARVGGGFPYTPPAAPCEAADECHGEGSTMPKPASVSSENTLGAGGNVKAAKKHKKKAKKHKKKPNARKKHAKKKKAAKKASKPGDAGAARNRRHGGNAR